MSATTAWSPEGFDDYRSLFPETPALAPEPCRNTTSRFITAWRAGEASSPDALRSRAADTTVVFVRGYLGNYMPGNLLAARNAVRRLGYDAFIARNAAGGNVATNAEGIKRHIATRGTRDRIIFCGHSRGGVECLTLLAADSKLAERCDGVTLSQTAFGPSRVIESVLLGQHAQSLPGRRRHLVERLQGSALRLIGADVGGRELSTDHWPALTASIAAQRFPFPVMQTASWSSRPTAWLDSYHERLGEISPGRAHDGQFYLDDLIWPAFPHILLPHLDHAQPVVGGHGFDAARYWVAALETMLQEPHAH